MLLVGCQTPAPREPAEVGSTELDVAPLPPVDLSPDPDTEAPLDAAPASGERAPTPLGPSITAVSGLAEIREKPSRTAPLVGLFRAGQSIRLREPAPVTPASPCPGGWYAVVPFGFVCLGEQTTLATDDTRAAAARLLLPDTRNALPFHVGTSIGAPRYRRVPTRDEQSEEEWRLDKHLAALPGPNDAAGGTLDGTPAGAPFPTLLSSTLFRPRGKAAYKAGAYPGMRVAWTHAFDAEGRTWLVTPEQSLIPRDKVRTKPPPTSVGVDIQQRPELTLPLAFVVGKEARRYALREGTYVELPERARRHEFIGVTTRIVTEGKRSFRETRSGEFLASEDITYFRLQTRPKTIGESDRWIAVGVMNATLVAYEGDTPRFAFAMSPGAGGAGTNAHGTPLGRFQVGWKFLSTDMWGEEGSMGWRVREVPWVAYYKDGFAIHGAWWHDDFGRPKSHGCLNLAPEDAKKLFAWMGPELPEGWYAVAAQIPSRRGTVVEVGP